MKNLIVCILFLCFGLNHKLSAQNLASKRASEMGLGMNLSYLDNYWGGSRANHFGDFVNMTELMKRKVMLANIAKAGFKTVRLPVCFSAFASIQAPYQWDFPLGLTAVDSMLKWCANNNLKVIVDFHHPEFDGSIEGANTIERKLTLWKSIAERYKNTDPEKVFFELQNEPHDVTATEWRIQANQLISTVRAIAPNHTFIVGFHDWNGRNAMIQSEPFADANIIYTFHYYDPFIFTHQGATWSSPEIKDLRNIPFPYSINPNITVPASAKGTWIEGSIKNYANEGTDEVIYNALSRAKDWSLQKNVPIFLGEFGSYSEFSDADSRCRHATAIYKALGLLEIPSAWWEWDAGFSMFQKGTTEISACMKLALENYTLKVLGLNEVPELNNIEVFPNPSQDIFIVRNTANNIATSELIDLQGNMIGRFELINNSITLSTQASGMYILKFFDAKNRILGYKKIIKL
ncbi:cellulase family glycosylhydrolase [Arcicella rigui]|uniref:Cellulase family glycosylhydrolase n=1 Tax=Arcicella rigui TaxID=797020 RepID=A0ABU5QDM1_9BACT|nr:cellulase family glycosylhydrolase [Arcicella rigui]MEA5140454.1 cellulase family glycosylhydrolase [Arcicella rigui]